MSHDKELKISHEKYMEIFLKGQEHREPSAKTIELINSINIALAKLPKEIIDELDKKYPTMEQFMPVRNLVFGFVGLILIATIGGLIKLVIN